MPTIDEVCIAAAGAIAAVPSLRAKPYPDPQINEPEVHVFTRDFDPRMVFGSAKKVLPFTGRLFVKATDSRAAHQMMRGFMDSTSAVLSAIETTDDWPGAATVDYAEVTLITGPAQIEIAGTIRWFVDFEFDVCF